METPPVTEQTPSNSDQVGSKLDFFYFRGDGFEYFKI